MTAATRIALLVMALALLAGAIWSAIIRDIPAAIMFVALATLCATFERLLSVHRG